MASTDPNTESGLNQRPVRFLPYDYIAVGRPGVPRRTPAARLHGGRAGAGNPDGELEAFAPKQTKNWRGTETT